MPFCAKCGTCYCKGDKHGCVESIGKQVQRFAIGLNVVKEVKDAEPDPLPEVQAPVDGLPEVDGDTDGEVPALQPPERATFRRNRR